MSSIGTTWAYDLGVAAAGGPALDAEDRAETRLSHREQDLLAQLPQRLGNPHCHSRLSFPGGGGVDRRHQHQAGLAGPCGQIVEPHLGLVLTVEDQVVRSQVQVRGDVRDGARLGCLRDLDIGRNVCGRHVSVW
jgi:hypothetical protein